MIQRKAVDRMSIGPEDIVVHGVRGGVPALIAFGQAGTPQASSPFEQGALLERLRQRSPREFSTLYLDTFPRIGEGGRISMPLESIEEAVAALRPLIDELRPSEVLTFGEGLGGYAALVAGARLRATRIVALEPPSHLIAEELALYHDRRWERALADFPDAVAARLYDVPALFDRLGYSGRAFVLFGTRRTNDHLDSININAIHAHRLALSGRVSLCPFPESGHGLLRSLIRGGDAEGVLSAYLFHDPPSAPEPGVEVKTTPPPRTNQKLVIDFKVSICNIEESRGYERASGQGAYAAVGAVNPRIHRHVEDRWRRWISENLMLRGAPKELESMLVEHGYTEEEAAAEVKSVQENPYFRGCRRLMSRYTKREWILGVRRKLNRLIPRSAKVDRIACPDRREFLDGYYAANRPVIITGVMDDWRSRNERELEALSQRLADGPRDGDRFRDEAELQAMFADALGDLPALSDYLDERRAGPRMIRLNPAGMSRSFQRNPTNTFLAQVIGRRRLWLVPSWDAPLMAPYLKEFPEPVPRLSPLPSAIPLNRPQFLECEPSPGEILFLPVSWWSSIEALDDSVIVASTES